MLVEVLMMLTAFGFLNLVRILFDLPYPPNDGSEGEWTSKHSFRNALLLEFSQGRIFEIFLKIVEKIKDKPNFLKILRFG